MPIYMKNAQILVFVVSSFVRTLKSTPVSVYTPRPGGLTMSPDGGTAVGCVTVLWVTVLDA